LSVDDRWPARLHIVTVRVAPQDDRRRRLALRWPARVAGRFWSRSRGGKGSRPLFNLGPLPYAERRVATTAAGGEVYALAADGREALLEYSTCSTKLGLAGRALQRFGAIDFATTIAPGMRDVLLTAR